MAVALSSAVGPVDGALVAPRAEISRLTGIVEDGLGRGDRRLIAGPGL